MSRLPVVIAVLVLVAACGGAGATTGPTATGAGATTGPTATGAGATTGPTATGAGATTGQATVQLGDTTLGKVLVGANGKTLYGFVPDVAAGKPSCNDACATTWPALTVTGDFSVGAGLDKSKFKTVARTDGSTQLQIGDHPLYYYAPDANAGDTGGQGIGGIWFVVGADGQLIGQP
jgi:predicted lipoprotein with Yx(FWY)xxD motif